MLTGRIDSAALDSGPSWHRPLGSGLVAVGAGIGVGCLLLVLGVSLELLFVPAAFFLFLIFPWLCRDPFRLLLWLIVTYQILWPTRIELPAGLPDLAYERVLGALLVGLIMLRAIRAGKPVPRLGLVAGTFAATLVILLARTLFLGNVVSPPFGDFINFLVVPLIIYWSARSLLESKRHVQWLMATLIFVSVLIGLTGVYERVLDLDESPFRVSSQTEAGDTRYGGVPGGRAAGVLGNPAIYGAMMGLGFLCCLSSLVNMRRLSSRFALSLVACFLLYAVYVSFTRSAWLSVALALLVVQFFIQGLWKRTLPLFLTAALGLGAVWVVTADSSIVQDRVLEKDNAMGRVDRAMWCLDRFAEKPALGWGFGATNFLMRQDFTEGGFSQSHNTFLGLLMDGGLLPLGCFLSLLLYWVAKAWMIARNAESSAYYKAVAAGMAGFVVIYALSGMAVELRYFGFFNSLLWIAGAVIERLPALANESNDSNDSNNSSARELTLAGAG